MRSNHIHIIFVASSGIKINVCNLTPQLLEGSSQNFQGLIRVSHMSLRTFCSEWVAIRVFVT